MPSRDRSAIAIVGAGPRGASLLERIGANLHQTHQTWGDESTHKPWESGVSRQGEAASPPLDIFVIDEAPSGAGKIWRSDQDRELCMNTLAHAVTLFTDSSSTALGPIRPGPTLYEWCILALHTAFPSEATARVVQEIPAEHTRVFHTYPTREGLAADYYDELQQTKPYSHPSRALYGEYLTWFYDRAVANLPANVCVVRHHARAVEIQRESKGERIDAIPSHLEVSPLVERPLEDDRGSAIADLSQIKTLSVPEIQVEEDRETATRTTSAVEILPIGKAQPEDDQKRVTVSAPQTEVAPTVEAQGNASRERVLLSDGTQVTADAVILATGWLPREENPLDQALAEAVARNPELVWVPPDSPVEQDLSEVPAGENVIVLGLGMGFFDVMALLTVGRGGRFVPAPACVAGLRYEPSGREPIMQVTSNRGVPFRAKTLYDSLPPTPPQRYARAVDWDRGARPIDFNRALWPRIVADAFTDYMDTIARVRPEAVTAPPEVIRGVIAEVLDGVVEGEDGQGSETQYLDEVVRRFSEAMAPFVPNPEDRFDLLAEMHPADQDFSSNAKFNDWVIWRTQQDLEEARRGRDSALKTGLWSISAARGLAGKIGTSGGFDAESRASGFTTLLSVGGMAGSGPPAFRIQELLALADAALVRFIGPQASVTVRDDHFEAESACIPGSAVSALALIAAWMPAHDIVRSGDPLTQSLVESERARPFSVPSRQDEDEDVATGSFHIDPETGLLIGADGSIDPSVHVVGIPVNDQLHGLTISPMPTTDPPMLRETDRTARSALRIAGVPVR